MGWLRFSAFTFLATDNRQPITANPSKGDLPPTILADC